MKVQITPHAYNKIMLYAQHAAGEISGLADVVLQKESGILLINEAYLLNQVSSAGHTEFDWDVFVDFFAGLKPEEAERKRCWWHSHNTFGTSPSGTDTTTISTWGAQGAEWLVSLVVNKRREYTCRYDVFKPVNIFIEHCELEVVQPPISQKLVDETRKEVPEKVKAPIIKVTESKGGRVLLGGGGGHMWDFSDPQERELFMQLYGEEEKQKEDLKTWQAQWDKEQEEQEEYKYPSERKRWKRRGLWTKE